MHFKTYSVRQAAIAYADNTTWLASSRKQLEELLAIAEEFYALNDIQINTQKSKLLVINPKVKIEEIYISFGAIRIKAEKDNTITRFLGI